MSETYINVRLPDDAEAEDEVAMIEAAEELYPSNPLLGLFRLNYLRKLAEGDCDRDDEWRA